MQIWKSFEIMADDFVSRFVNEMPDFIYKKKDFAVRIKRNVQNTISVLQNTEIGEMVVFRGSCPSGYTFDRPIKWDGQEETKEKIVQETIKKSTNDAWYASLVKVSENEQSIGAARMRTN